MSAPGARTIGVSDEGVKRPSPATSFLGRGSSGGIAFVPASPALVREPGRLRLEDFLRALLPALLVATMRVYKVARSMGVGARSRRLNAIRARVSSYHKVTGEG